MNVTRPGFVMAHFVALLACLALSAAQPAESLAQQLRPSFKFEIKTVDPSTGQSKTTYSVGETVSVVFSLTNQGGAVRKIEELQDTEIPVVLTWKRSRGDDIETREGVRGGTGDAYTTPEGTTVWTSRKARSTVISPGQTINVTIDDLRRFFATHLDDGEYTLTATYSNELQARCSFKIVVDEARSLPLLERMAKNDDGSEVWAAFYLRFIRQPSISGRVALPGGKGLKEVWISVAGPEKTNIETRSGGRYELISLIPGGTYTLTPSLEGYTFNPPSRTVTNLTSKLAGVNFTARRVRSVSSATR